MRINFKIVRACAYQLLLSGLFITAQAQDSSKQSPVEKISKYAGIKYDLTFFDKAEKKPWHLLSLEYAWMIKKAPLITRLNYAGRFNRSGLQLEADAYPKISKNIYAYVNAGYSKDTLLFPGFRTGLSLYTSLPKGYEAEAGFRLLYFNAATWIYTASLGKYYKRYWFNVSAFLTPSGNRFSQSYFLKTRYYLSDKDFIMLTAGTGVSPDDRNNNIQLIKTGNLSSKKIEISSRVTFNKVNVILLSAGLVNQEYELKHYTYQYTISIGLQRLF